MTDYDENYEFSKDFETTFKKRRPVKPTRKWKGESEKHFEKRLSEYMSKKRAYKHIKGENKKIVKKHYNRCGVKITNTHGENVVALTDTVTRRKVAPSGTYRLRIVNVEKVTGGH